MTKEPSRRQLKLGQELKKIAQDFFQREATRSSLITVTEAEIAPDLKNATFRITVLPEKNEIEALNFARKKRNELRSAIKSALEIRTIPYVTIEIDKGEKARQKIDTLLYNEKHKDEKIDIDLEGNPFPIVDEEIVRTGGSLEEDKLASEMD